MRCIPTQVSKDDNYESMWNFVRYRYNIQFPCAKIFSCLTCSATPVLEQKIVGIINFLFSTNLGVEDLSSSEIVYAIREAHLGQLIIRQQKLAKLQFKQDN